MSDREPFRTIYYPNVSDRERAAVIAIEPGTTINNINIVVPKLEETITIEGVLRYSDGSLVAEEWVKFRAINTDNQEITATLASRLIRAGGFL